MKLAVLANSPLALPALHELLRQGVVAGVGVPATPGAEGPERIRALAASAGVPVTRVAKATLAADLRAWLASAQPDAVMVFTFPWRVPDEVLTLAPLGWYNVHLAPLPAYRGAEPLFWLLRNGEAASAVTVHEMTAAFDAGPIVWVEPVPIAATDTHGLLQAKLAGVAVGVVAKVVAALRGTGAPLTPRPQEVEQVRYWPRPTLPDLCIDWREPADVIRRLVRAANPWNRGAFATLRGQPLRVLAATRLSQTTTAAPGTILKGDVNGGLLVACGNKQVMSLDILALEEGYFTGSQLAALGIRPGEVLSSPVMPLPTAAVA